MFVCLSVMTIMKDIKICLSVCFSICHSSFIHQSTGLTVLVSQLLVMFSISYIWPMSACFPGDKEMMAKVEDRCKKLLDSDEYSVVMKHIKKVCDIL